jgi:ABC-type polysaccharide/polyol phosphate export permease
LSQRSRILRIVRVDVSYFFRTKWLIATLIGLNLSDMLVLGLVYNGMMSFNYFAFFVPGVVIAGMFAAALDVGRRVYLGLTEGVIQYYLSLPVSTDGLVWAHIISGGLGGTIYSGILLAVALAILPHASWLAALAMLPMMFMLSMGLSGIAAVLNLFSKRGERYWVFADGLQVAFLGMSTISYPISVIQSVFPGFLTTLIEYNPLSQGVGALRSWVFGGQPVALGALGSLILTSLVLLAMGAVSYRHVFYEVREVGKI